MAKYILPFSSLTIQDVPKVGGKNASLGEMVQKLTPLGIKVPDGFATTAEAYQFYLTENGMVESLRSILSELDTKEFSNLHQVGEKCRTLLLSGKIPSSLAEEIKEAYRKLQKEYHPDIQLAVRSSATAEDLPNASFAGQQETYLNIKGEDNLVNAVQRCFASLFTDRAIKYRQDRGFEHMKVYLSVGVQLMVRSDKASSGVGFTLDPETGFDQVIYISGAWGLGENVVQGTVNTDDYYLFKPSLKKNLDARLNAYLGAKQLTMIYSDHGVNPIENIPTPEEKRKQFVLNSDELHQLGKWFLKIEEHYGRPMDIEWAKDGITGELFIVQARPETVHANNKRKTILKEYQLKTKSSVLCSGTAIGERIVSGVVRVLNSPEDSDKLKTGEILVTDTTNPDWDPIMKKAAAIITDKGGRTSHAAIVARELGALALVGCQNATEVLKDGDLVTVSCTEGNTGYVYQGKLVWEERETDLSGLEMPTTKSMLILADPGKAFEHALLPNNGVGLLRMEFIINNSIRIHPMALVDYQNLKDIELKNEIDRLTYGYTNKSQFFVEKLADALATIAAAFYPKPVIVRMSDFKSNEYANLIGGKVFEPIEENPMIGFRGASRYYHPRYKDAFRLECLAIKKVREDKGLDNVKVMIPFCRTVEEGNKVLEEMSKHGLNRGDKGLEVYVMAEIPSNIILAEYFADIFDGFSIGSNDLTQLTLGLDRDSDIVAEIFDENNEAVKISISSLIRDAKAKGRKVGICGQGPSDSPEFAAFLVGQGIDSISFNPDALLKGIENIKRAEKKTSDDDIMKETHEELSKHPEMFL